MDHLVGILAVAFTGFFVAQVIRVQPIVQPWLARGTKPWACNICMGWWCSLLVATVAFGVLAVLTSQEPTLMAVLEDGCFRSYWADGGWRWFCYAPASAGIAMTLLDHYAGLPPHMDPPLPELPGAPAEDEK